jgi:hypothetical protein
MLDAVRQLHRALSRVGRPAQRAPPGEAGPVTLADELAPALPARAGRATPAGAPAKTPATTSPPSRLADRRSVGSRVLAGRGGTQPPSPSWRSGLAAGPSATTGAPAAAVHEAGGPPDCGAGWRGVYLDREAERGLSHRRERFSSGHRPAGEARRLPITDSRRSNIRLILGAPPSSPEGRDPGRRRRLGSRWAYPRVGHHAGGQGASRAIRRPSRPRGFVVSAPPGARTADSGPPRSGRYAAQQSAARAASPIGRGGRPPPRKAPISVPMARPRARDVSSRAAPPARARMGDPELVSARPQGQDSHRSAGSELKLQNASASIGTSTAVRETALAPPQAR